MRIKIAQKQKYDWAEFKNVPLPPHGKPIIKPAKVAPSHIDAKYIGVCNDISDNVYDVDGNYNPNDFPGAQKDENPMAIANELLDNTGEDRIIANIALNFKLHKDLTFRTKLGTNYKRAQTNYYLPSTTIEGAKVGGEATITNINGNYWVNENIFYADLRWWFI